MAFVVETGQGLDTANAYAEVDDVDSYHADRGNTKWTGTDLVKEAAIIRATDYIDKRFGKRFRGTRLFQLQGLRWPRYGAYDDSGFPYPLYSIPPRLVQATAEYALRALIYGELAADPPLPTPGMNNATDGVVTQDGLGKIIGTEEDIGPLKEVTRYETSEQASKSTGRASISDVISTINLPEYPAADLLLEELIDSTSNRKLRRG